jgi:hypothetical protein
MQTINIDEVNAVDGSIFLDNVTVSSADRLLHTRYGNLLDNEFFKQEGVITALVHHDVLNLALLTESLVCHDTIYINAEFIDRWNQNIEQTSLQRLANIIVPVLWSPDTRYKDDNKLREKLGSELGRMPRSISTLEGIVFYTMHHPYSISKEAERDLFIPYKEGYAFGLPRSLDLGMGAVFYLMCSQVLGIPYKPCILRAPFIAQVIKDKFDSRKFNAADIIIALLEKSREEAIQEYFEKVLELNMIEVNIPCILSAVLRNSTSLSDVIPLTIQLRESREAKAFRQWCNNLTQIIQQGDLAKIAEAIKEVKDLVTSWNKFLGLTRGDNVDVSLGWGPASVSIPFSLPRLLQRPIHFKRHLSFLHRIYSISLKTARSSEYIDRVLLSNLPEELQVKKFHSDRWAAWRSSLRQ